MTDPDNQAQEQEEHYRSVAEALRDLFNGIGDEEDVALLCNELGLDSRDVV
jgi:hypothetical protein